MPYEQFEEWLERQDIPLEDQLEVDKYIAYLAEQFGITGGSLEYARNVYTEKYDLLPQFGIHAFEMEREVRGIPVTETRYAIKGLRGAFGRERAFEIAAERADERGLIEAEIWLSATLRRIRGEL